LIKSKLRQIRSQINKKRIEKGLNKLESSNKIPDPKPQCLSIMDDLERNDKKTIEINSSENANESAKENEKEMFAEYIQYQL